MNNILNSSIDRIGDNGANSKLVNDEYGKMGDTDKHSHWSVYIALV